MLQTGSQTVGPFFHYALITGGQHILVNDKTKGTRISIFGTITDGDGQAVPDAFLEIWQADSNGIFNHPSDPQFKEADPQFKGFGRSATDQTGRYLFETIKPGVGSIPVPYINARVFARGMLIHAVTRIYFSDEPNNLDDPMFAALPHTRRHTLVAERDDSEGRPRYRFDVQLQGDNETVFFDV